MTAAEYQSIDDLQGVWDFLNTSPVGARAIYWSGWHGPTGPDNSPEKKMFALLHRLFEEGKVHLVQEKIPRRGFDFIVQKR